MIISRFNYVWMGIIVFAICSAFIMRKILAERTREQKCRIMGFFYVALFALWCSYKYGLSQDPQYDFVIWNEMPLHICNVCTLLGIIASFKDNERLQAFCYYIGTIAAPVAMIVVYPGFLDIPLFSAKGLGFWGYHSLLLGASISFATSGLYKPKFKDIPKTLFTLFICAGLVHIVNYALEQTVYAGADYFFTRGIKGIAFTETMYKIIPIPVICMAPAIIPLYLGACILTLPAYLTERHIDKEKRNTEYDNKIIGGINNG